MLTITAVKAIVASYVDGRKLCGIEFMRKAAVYRIMSGNNGKNACACSDLFNALLYSSAVVALHIVVSSSTSLHVACSINGMGEYLAHGSTLNVSMRAASHFVIGGRMKE
mmetsp:Transcript_26414/g.39360  ORF Transcript_26414/g.39360 Transcript_26414/m.39360 type:complete len:110 (+) Transcript_26414:113-442(+)